MSGQTPDTSSACDPVVHLDIVSTTFPPSAPDQLQQPPLAPSNRPVTASTASTPACPLASSSLTLSANSNTCNPSTQDAPSSATVPPVSISNAKASRRYWNSRLKGVYASCTLPTETDYAALHTISSNTYSRVTACKSSWTHTTRIPPPSRISQTTSFKSSPFLALASTASAAAAAAEPMAASANKRSKKQTVAPPTEIPPLNTDAKRKATPFKRAVPVEGYLRTYKVRMLPTATQVTELKRTFSAARFAFNWALDRVKNHDDKPNAISLRNAFRAANPLPAWGKDSNGSPLVASRILAGAVKQVADAHASNFAKWRKDKSHTFEVRFRSTRRTQSEVIKIDKAGNDKSSQSPLRSFERLARPYDRNTTKRQRAGRCECLASFGSNLASTGGILLQDKAHVIEKLLAEGTRLREDAKILYDKRTNHFHFVYTFESPRLVDPDPTFETKRVVAHDPGVRAFQTWYSPTTGTFGELLNDFQTQIEPRLLALDSLRSRIDTRYHGRVLKSPPQNRSRRQWLRTTRTLQRKWYRDLRRHHGWLESAHYDAANFMLKHNDIIVQPWLHCARLVQRSSRDISSTTVRTMLTMSHYKYRQRLQWAATRYAGRHVFITEEPGTSKTCVNCGYWHNTLGCNKVFECPSCGISILRDINGAIGNLFAAYGDAVGIGWDGQSE